MKYQRNTKTSSLPIPLSMVLLFLVSSVYAFDPVTHGFIGEQAQKVVVLTDKVRHPDPYVFETGSITADVMQLDNRNMHVNKAFSHTMMDKAEDFKQLSFGAGFLSHQCADDAWAEWANGNGVPRGGISTPLEWGYEFFFAAYAVLYNRYAVPATLYMDEKLIRDTYKKLTGNELPASSLELNSRRDGIWSAMIAEVLLLATTSPALRAAFDSPVGPAATVKKSFENPISSAVSASVQEIGKKWFEFEPVKEGSVVHSAGALGKKWHDKITLPRLAKGWMRLDPKFVVTKGGVWGSGYSWSWLTTDTQDPSIEIGTGCNTNAYIKVEYTIGAMRLFPKEEKKVVLSIQPDLLDEIANKRKTMGFTIDEPLLTKSQVTIQELKEKQNSLLAYIGSEEKSVAGFIQPLNLKVDDKGELIVSKENRPKLVNQIAKSSNEIERSLHVIQALESRKQVISAHRDLIQPMPKKNLP